ncbi:unnamed protein product [Blepharisma stoltei]|uniref:Uncharacterized protein n=1 Tax=Blepharisma stoltei TaxID=1481888 RepID=A0AAU9KCL6_9CILI|nr:unnamed protein product [Blepharisma stoltei]
MHLSKSNIHDPSYSADPEALFVANRSNLKSIFSQHSPQDNKISFSEFCKFCKHTQIFPDLISMLDIKRVVTRVTQYQNSRSSLTYQNFEQSLKYIAIAAYHGLSLTEALRNLFLKIASSSKEIYNVIITLQKHSRGNTPLLCDTSGFEFEDNRHNNKGYLHSYSQKQFFKKEIVRTNINNDKKHYRTLSGGTYVLQSPRFGGGSTLIPLESDRYSHRDLRRSVDLKPDLKKKNIEKLFFKFREDFKKNENLKPKASKEPCLTSLRKHRNYITKVRSNGFTGNMVMRMIFSAWKGLASSKHQTN